MTTLTKRMAEDLTDHLLDAGIKVNYMHSDTATMDRVEILRTLREGKIDVLVGINLLREGLDLPRSHWWQFSMPIRKLLAQPPFADSDDWPRGP